MHGTARVRHEGEVRAGLGQQADLARRQRRAGDLTNLQQSRSSLEAVQHFSNLYSTLVCGERHHTIDTTRVLSLGRRKNYPQWQAAHMLS